MYDAQAQPGWFDWFGLALAILGFLLGWRQLYKTRSASEAANRALDRAQQRLVFDQLTVMYGQLDIIVSDLDFSIGQGDRAVAHRALIRFSDISAQVLALIAAAKVPDGPLGTIAGRFELITSSALDAKARIVARKDSDVARIAKAVSKEIQFITVDLKREVTTGRYELKDGSK